MNTWPSPMRILFFASDNWHLHFWPRVMWLYSKTWEDASWFSESKFWRQFFSKVLWSKFDFSFPVLSVHLLIPKDFTTKKQSSLIHLSQLPWYRWTNLGTSFHKWNSNVFLQFPFRSANLLEISLRFSVSVDFQGFNSGQEILKRIASSLWSICRSARTCGASVNSYPGVKLENEGWIC